MTRLKTYIDTGVYILALKSRDEEQVARALNLIRDPRRLRVASDVIRVEMLPTALRRNDRDEIKAINNLMAQAKKFVRISHALIESAIKEQAN